VNVSLSIYRAGGQHKLTVVARPRNAACLGEYVLIEGYPLGGQDDSEDAAALLAAAYAAVLDQLARRKLR
jgi:hypothetical protein